MTIRQRYAHTVNHITYEHSWLLCRVLIHNYSFLFNSFQIVLGDNDMRGLMVFVRFQVLSLFLEEVAAKFMFNRSMVIVHRSIACLGALQMTTSISLGLQTALTLEVQPLL